MTYTPAPRDPNQPPVRINLLSDTQTRPTPAMRDAMARAEVGDEQTGDDPSVNELCERVADLLVADFSARHRLAHAGRRPGLGVRQQVDANRWLVGIARGRGVGHGGFSSQMAGPG